MTGNDGSERGEADELRARLARWATPAPGLPDFERVAAELEVQLAAERGPRAYLRSRSSALRLALAAGLLCGLAALMLVAWPRLDLALYPAERMLLTIVAFGALFACTAWLSLWPLQQPAPAAWLRTATLVVAPALLLGLYGLPPAHGAHRASLQAPGFAALLLRAAPCLGFGLVIAGGLYGLLYALERGAPGRALWMGLSGGLAANVLLQLHCPSTAPAHLLLGHFGVVVLALACVALFERRRRAR